MVHLPVVSPGMVAVGDCSWNGYSSLILSYILLIGILWCGCGFIPGVCSCNSQRNSNIASMSGSFFRGGGSGHFGDLWGVFMIVSVCAMGGGVCEGGANFAHRLTVPIISEVNRSPKVFIQAVI